VRDHVLGVTAVSGFAEIFKAGGRVVKNVTGYDVCKVLTGSWGTLAAITEVTLKVMPKAEAECTVVLRNLDERAACRAMIAALGSPFDVSGAAHIPRSALRSGDGVGGLAVLGGDHATLLRIEGIEASVRHRAGLLERLLKPFGSIAILHDESQAIWSDIRDVRPFAANGPHGAWTVWRIICPASSVAQFGQALVRETGGDLIYDWGGGLIWAALPPAADGYAAVLRARLKPLGGHAMLFRADEEIRRRVDVFEPQPPALAALEQRLRLSFDPNSVFNPARIVRARTA
jgi:glycolate oxidase FAD binding subunit